MLGRIRALTVDDQGVVYVLHRPAAVTAFAESGEVLWSKEAPGQGPGRLDHPTSIAWDGLERIVIGNAGGTRLDFWDRKGGEFLESLAVETLGMRIARAIGPVRGGGILLAEPVFGALGIRLVTLDVVPAVVPRPVLDSVVSLAPEVSVGERFAPDVDVYSDAWSAIGIGDSHDNSVAVLDADGTEKTVLSVEPEYAPMTPLILEADGRGVMISLGELLAPRRLPSGDWLVKGSWPTRSIDAAALQSRWAAGASVGEISGELAFECAWFVFSPSGEITMQSETESGRVSSRGVLAAIDRQGRVLTIRQDPYPHVARWTMAPR